MACASPPRAPPLQHISEVLLHCDIESISSSHSSKAPEQNDPGSGRRGDGSGSDVGWNSWQDLVKAGQQSLKEAQRELLERVEQDVRESVLLNGELAAQWQGTVFEPMAAAVSEFLQTEKAERSAQGDHGSLDLPTIHTYEPATSLPRRSAEVLASTNSPAQTSCENSNSRSNSRCTFTEAESVLPTEITEEETVMSTAARVRFEDGITDNNSSIPQSTESASSEDKTADSSFPPCNSKEPRNSSLRRSEEQATCRSEDLTAESVRTPTSGPAGFSVSRGSRVVSFGEDHSREKADDRDKEHALGEKPPGCESSAARLSSVASYSTSASTDFEPVTRIHSLSSFNAASVLAELALDSDIQRDTMATLNKAPLERNEVIELESAAGNEQPLADLKSTEPDTVLSPCTFLCRSVSGCFAEKPFSDAFQEITVETARSRQGDTVETQLPVVQMHSSHATPPTASSQPRPEAEDCAGTSLCSCPACWQSTISREERAEGMDRQPRHRAATILPPLIGEDVMANSDDMLTCKMMPIAVCRPFAFACGGC